MLFGCDDEPDEDVIGRLDGGGGNEVVRRWEFSITYPEGSANDARALHASLARMRQITCLDDDGDAPADLYCPVTFDHSDRAVVPIAGEVRGVIAAARVLVDRGTTVTVVNNLNVPGVDPAGWTLADDAQIPEAFRMELGGSVELGIVINGSTFDKLRMLPDMSEAAVRARLGETIAHEFGHLAGLNHIPCAAESASFMCPSVLAAGMAQQSLMDRVQCEALYISDALDNAQGTDSSIVARDVCLQPD